MKPKTVASGGKCAPSGSGQMGACGTSYPNKDEGVEGLECSDGFVHKEDLSG